MNRAIQAALAFATLLAVVGCGGSTVVGNDKNPRVRVVNELSSPAAVDLYVDNEKVASGATQGTVTDYKIFNNGNRSVKVIDSATNAVVIDQTPLFELNHHYTVVAYRNGEAADTLVLDDKGDQGGSQVGIRFAKVATGVSDSVDVYVTGVDDDITTATPTFADVTTGSSNLGYTTLPAGTYRVRVTAHDQKVPLINDTVTLQAGQSVTLLDNGTTNFVKLSDQG